jgi:exosortase/archaeosortase family protein
MIQARSIGPKLVDFARSNYRLILLIALALLSAFIVYGNDFLIVANEALQNESFSHVLLLPFFVGFLFYLKKDVVKASLVIDAHRKRTSAKYVNEVLGVILCLVAFLIYWYGSYTFYPLEYHLFSFPIFVMGITLFLLNSRALLMLIFPILFLLFLIPLPATVLYTAGGAMSSVNTQISYTILKALGVPITLSTSYGAPAVLLTSAAGQSVNFAVDIPCSGIYSLVAFTMFAAFLAFVSKTSIFKKLLVFVLGFSVFALLNLIRIIGIFSVGYLLGEEAAILTHSVAGLILIFIGMVLILVISDKILKIKILTRPQEQQPCPKCTTMGQHSFMGFCQSCGRFLGGGSNLLPSKTLLVKLLLLVLGCSVVILSIRAPTFATAQGSLELLSGNNWQNATNVLPEISNYTLSFLYRDTAYERIAHQDASLVYGYFPVNISSPVLYVDIGIASSISNLHNWEVCLISMQTVQGQYPLVDVLDSKDTRLLQDPPVIAQYLVFDSPENYTQVTLYWYEKATFKTGLTVEQKYVRISLIILTQDSATYVQFEEELFKAGQIIASHLEPLKTEALISLGIPAQQSLLVVCIVFLIITKTAQYLDEQRRTANNLKVFNNFASKKEKIVLNSISELNKESTHMKTKDIIESVQKRVVKPVNPQTALKILKTLEEQGFIRRAVASINNAPVLEWKM